MKISAVLMVILAALSFSSAGAEAAGTFTENFNGTLSQNLQFCGTPGFSYAIADGKGTITEAAGIGIGYCGFLTNFDIVGDFTITVQADRTSLGNALAGLVVYNGDSFADVFFYNAAAISDIRGNISFPPGFPSGEKPDSSLVVTFKLQRTGNTLVESYDGGNGDVVVDSNTIANLPASVRARMFLEDDQGDLVQHQVSFANFSITADALRFPGVVESSILFPTLLLDD